MPLKKNGAKTAASPSPDKARASCRDALTASSPSVSEQWSSPGMEGDAGASSASPAQTAGGKQAKGKSAAGRAKLAVVKGTGTTVRGAGKPLTKTRTFRAAEEPSPQIDQDFAELSRGRETSGTRRGLMHSINESTASASTHADAGQLAVAAAAAPAPHKPAPTLSQISATSPETDSMADLQTQDADGQASAPDMQFQVNGVRCECARLRVWLSVCVWQWCVVMCRVCNHVHI